MSLQNKPSRNSAINPKSTQSNLYLGNLQKSNKSMNMSFNKSRDESITNKKGNSEYEKPNFNSAIKIVNKRINTLNTSVTSGTLGTSGSNYLNTPSSLPFSPHQSNNSAYIKKDHFSVLSPKTKKELINLNLVKIGYSLNNTNNNPNTYEEIKTYDTYGNLNNFNNFNFTTKMSQMGKIPGNNETLFEQINLNLNMNNVNNVNVNNFNNIDTATKGSKSNSISLGNGNAPRTNNYTNLNSATSSGINDLIAGNQVSFSKDKSKSKSKEKIKQNINVKNILIDEEVSRYLQTETGIEENNNNNNKPHIKKTMTLMNYINNTNNLSKFSKINSLKSQLNEICGGGVENIVNNYNSVNSFNKQASSNISSNANFNVTTNNGNNTSTSTNLNSATSKAGMYQKNMNYIPNKKNRASEEDGVIINSHTRNLPNATDKDFSKINIDNTDAIPDNLFFKDKRYIKLLEELNLQRKQNKIFKEEDLNMKLTIEIMKNYIKIQQDYSVKREKEKLNKYIVNENKVNMHKQKIDEEITAVIKENKVLKLSVLKILYLIQIFEVEEQNRNFTINKIANQLLKENEILRNVSGNFLLLNKEISSNNIDSVVQSPTKKYSESPNKNNPNNEVNFGSTINNSIFKQIIDSKKYCYNKKEKVNLSSSFIEVNAGSKSSSSDFEQSLNINFNKKKKDADLFDLTLSEMSRNNKKRTLTHSHNITSPSYGTTQSVNTEKEKDIVLQTRTTIMRPIIKTSLCYVRGKKK